MKISALIKSFKHAAKGVKYVFKHEQNFRIQVFAAILILLLAFIWKLTRAEIIVILLLIFLVLILELINSAFEKFADILKPRLDLQVGIVKDIMAGMVFCASLAAVIIGLVIFWPYIF